MPLGVGLFTALYGVVFAAVQTDMKRLLAYSSIENIGIIFTGIGLAIVFHGVGMHALGALALIARALSRLNHAFMKSLLFLGTGAVLHATGERNLGRLGGLIHRMPWVAWLTLVGALAIAGLPPLNGFVSEWLLLQAFLFAHEVPQPFVNMLLPLGAAVVALAAALAAYVMVKFFGVIFLGQPREPSLANAHDAGMLERIGLVWLALGCVAARLAAHARHRAARASSTEQFGISIAHARRRPGGCSCRVPERQASYSAARVSRRDRRGRRRLRYCVVQLLLSPARRDARAPWDCGFARLDARMQDTAEGFGQPIRHIFQPFFAMRARAADAVRPRAALSRDGRRSHLARAVSADRHARAAQSRTPSRGCSRAASRRICSTASSRSWCCWRSCYEAR